MSVVIENQGPPPTPITKDVVAPSPTISEASVYSDEKIVFLPEGSLYPDEKNVSPIAEEAPMYTEFDPSMYSDLPEVVEGPIPDFKKQPTSEPSTARVLQIKARGKELLRLPTAPRETVTLITELDGKIAYTYSRQSPNSAEAILSDTDGAELVRTDFYSKWGRSPILHHVRPQEPNSYGITEASGTSINVKEGIWPSSSIKFGDPRSGKEFEWRYRKSVKDINGKSVRVMALIMIDRDAEGNPSENLLATLIRGKGTRQQGSNRFTAGNGGQLAILEHCTEHLPEELVISSCMLMLKKEVDRRRAYQALTLVAIVL